MVTSGEIFYVIQNVLVNKHNIIRRKLSSSSIRVCKSASLPRLVYISRSGDIRGDVRERVSAAKHGGKTLRDAIVERRRAYMSRAKALWYDNKPPTIEIIGNIIMTAQKC